VPLDHRLAEARTNWKVFKDGEHIIITGSVARSDDDIHMFVWVTRILEGSVDTEFLQIGDKVAYGVSYPQTIFPYNNE